MTASKPVLAMVTDSIQPYFSGGKEARYFELSRRLTDDFDVHVHTMQWWSGPRTIRRDGVTLHALCPRVDMYQHSGRRSIRQALVFALGCLRLLGTRFDVLEADHMPYIHLFTLRLVCWLKRRRMIVTWHEVWGLSYWRSYLGSAGVLAYAVEAVAMRLPDEIIAASEHTAARLKRILGEEAAVHAAPNGVDVVAIEATPPADSRADVVTVGRLMSHKRIDLLLDVIAELKQTHGRVTCRVIGSGPEEDRLARQVERLGLTDDVELLTDVKETDRLIALVKSSRVFVLTSEREGFGIAALEGLACGLPVVTTSAPDNLAQHLVAEAPGGLVCQPLLEPLVTEVGALLHQHGRGDGHPDRRDWLDAYSWPAITAQVSNVLRTAAGRRPTSTGVTS